MMFHRGREISLRRTFLLTSDVLIIGVSLLLAAIWRLGPQGGVEYIDAHRWSLGGACTVFLIIFYASGMYERGTLARASSSYRLPLVAVSISLAVVVLIFYAKAQGSIGRGVLFLAGTFIFLATWGTRHLYGMAVGWGLLSKNALIVGEGWEAEAVVRLVARTADSGFKILGIASSKKMDHGSFIAGVPVVGSTEKLRELVGAFDIETIIVATSLSREPTMLRLLRPLRCAGIEVIDYTLLFEQLAHEVPIDHINDEWLMNAAMNGSVIHIRKVKRIMDFVLALVGLILTAPICILTFILIKLDSSGPALYRQKRAGIDGNAYMVMKFRTMRQDAEAKSGAVWSTKNDSRVTRIGNWLRKWRIDEIPQLVNVLKGEMSLVGPRPERPEFIDTLSSAIPFYRERLMVPPGVTGWAQVMYPYSSDIEGARRKLQFDLYYIKHMGFFLDVMILLQTFRTVIQGLKHDESSEGSEQTGTVDEFPSSHTKSGEVDKTA